MVLRRSESTRTTFSVYVTRKTKYQRYLGIINVVMLMCSLTMVFSGLSLKLTYYMDQLGFVSGLFQALPISLMVVGVLTFLLSAAGFIFSASEQRRLIMCYGGMTAFLAIAQIATVFQAMLVRSSIVAGGLDNQVGSAIDRYNEDQAVRDKWDYLHTRLRCCGAYGYEDYLSLRNEHFKCVPRSCCFGAQLGATGRDVLGGSIFSVSAAAGRCNWGGAVKANNCPNEGVLHKSIYVRGCLEILGEMYKTDLVNLLLFYGVGGTAFALIELTAVSLAFAYAAQISRRAKREREQWQPGEDLTAGHNHGHGGAGGGGSMHMDNFKDEEVH